jgi:hypothetical protein
MADLSSNRPDIAVETPEAARASRRGFLLASLGVLLGGCSSTRQTVRTMPGPAWDVRPSPHPASDDLDRLPGMRPGESGAPRFAGVLPRSRWAEGDPVPALMNRMKPVRYITVHHDGMSPFYGNDASSAASRLESIRRAHRGKPQPWGDIGYHFAVDRAGNVWECRPLTYQGAHVKDYNEHNVGVLALGNFDEQRPTERQLNALRRHVRVLMDTYEVSVSRLRTHQEWAATACPGRSLQSYMVSARGGGVFA